MEIPNFDNNEEVEDDEETNLNSEAYVQILKEICYSYGQEVSQWCIFLITNNSRTNLRISSITGKSHIGCNSNKVNLEVKKCSNHILLDLQSTSDSVHKTIKSGKEILKN